MREFGKLLSRFWDDYAHLDADAQRLACYLFSCKHGNMLGLFRLPIGYPVADLNMAPEGASKALAKLHAEGLIKYCESSGWLFVKGAAEEHIGDEMKPTDNRWKAANKLLASLKRHAFLGDFLDRYSTPFQLDRSSFEAPSKPLRDQQQAPSKQVEVEVEVEVDPPKAPQGAGLWSGRFDQARASEYLQPLSDAWGGSFPQLRFNQQRDVAERLHRWVPDGSSDADVAARFAAVVAWTRRDFQPKNKVELLLSGDLDEAMGDVAAADAHTLKRAGERAIEEMGGEIKL